MPPEEPTTPNPEPTSQPSEETKEKLRQIRTNFTRSQTITAEIESYYQQFLKIRDELDNKDDGLEANHEWSKTKKTEMDNLVQEATTKLQELDTTLKSIETLTEEVKTKHTEFTALANIVFDPTNGLDALFKSAQNFYNQIVTFRDNITTIDTNAAASLKNIKDTEAKVQAAYDEFVELKTEVDDPKAGIKASLDEIRQYAEDALAAKTGAESNALSVTALKDEVTKNRDTAKAARGKVEEYEKESAKLTSDIRNNLNLSTAESLSEALRSHAKTLNDRIKFWGWVLGISISFLVAALVAVFYALYIYHTSAANITQKIDSGPTLVAVLSKVIFTSPLIFAVYFATSNFSRVRDLRDRFAFKETVAKNLQAYVDLLKTDFNEPDYKPKRLEFTLRTMRLIYKEPEAQTRRRKYNIGINKVFQFKSEQEDIERLEEKLVEGAEEVVKSKNEASKSD